MIPVVLTPSMLIPGGSQIRFPKRDDEKANEATARICIIGSPRAGKTTYAKALAEQTGAPLYHSDDHQHLGWSGCSKFVAEQLSAPGPWIWEGVAVVRALRKWMQANAGKPCDEVIWMPIPRAHLTSGQETMRKGCETVWDDVRPELKRRGVELRWLGIEVEQTV